MKIRLFTLGLFLLSYYAAQAQPAYDLAFAEADTGSTLEDYFTIAQPSNNYIAPVFQQDSTLYHYAAKVVNQGSQDEIGASLYLEIIWEDYYSPSHTDTVIRDTLFFDLAAAADTMLQFSPSFVPEYGSYFSEGRYSVHYRLQSSGNDTLLSNNEAERSFVSSSTSGYWHYWSKVPNDPLGGPAYSSHPQLDTLQGYTLTKLDQGSMFYAPNECGTLDTVSYRLADLTDSSSTMTGSALVALVFAWDDKDGDGQLPVEFLFSSNSQPEPSAELELIAVGVDTLDSNVQDGDWRKIGLIDAITIPAEPEVDLEGGRTYLIVIRSADSTGVKAGVKLYDSLNYALSTHLSAEAGLPLWPSPVHTEYVDSLGNPWQANYPEGTWSSWGTGPHAVPAIRARLRFGNYASYTCFTSTKEAEEGAPSLNLSLYPNPSSSSLFVAYEGPATELSYQVFDMQGRLLYETQRAQDSGAVFEYDVRHLPAGMYLMRVRSDEAVKTLPFVVQSGR